MRSSASNRLAAIGGPRPAGFSYDPNGNVTAGRGIGYVYDGFNRMASSTRAGVTTTYAVNALGQRVHKNTPNVSQTWFVYGPDNSLLAEYKSGGQGWTNYLRASGEVVGMTRGGQLRFVHNDHLGRPELVTNANKTVQWRASNYAFGRTVTQDSIGGLNLGFPGQYYDVETGNWNNGFRDYDDAAGRYLQSDPIGMVAGTNTYAYVEGDPISYVDPFGLQQIPRDVQSGINQAIIRQRTQQGLFYGSPDFVNVSVSWFKFSLTISRTKYGKNFIAPGINLNQPSTKNPFLGFSASINIGYVCPKDSEGLKTEDQINDALAGGGTSVSGYYYAGGGMSWGPTANTYFWGVGLGGGSAGSEVGYEF